MGNCGSSGAQVSTEGTLKKYSTPSNSDNSNGINDSTPGNNSGPNSPKTRTSVYRYTDNTSQEHAFNEKYRISSELGSGAHSVVKLAYNNENNEMVAVKIVSSQSLTEEDIAALEMEIEILSKLHHPNIISLHEVFQGLNDYYIVTELVQGGELFERIVNKSYYSELEARNLIKFFIETMAFVHSQDICHRDLKPENLLLVSEEDDSDLKIADFGYAKRISELDNEPPCGTPGYVAPEILRGDAYGGEVDIWSMGVICYVLLAGYPPFYDEDTRKLYKKIRMGNYQFHDEHWSSVSPDAKDLITKMLTVDQKKRWTAAQLLQHPWIVSTDTGALSSRGLAGTIENMKKFNARTKFKAGVRAVIVSNRMMNMSKKPNTPGELGVQQADRILLPHQSSFLGKKDILEIIDDQGDE